MEKAKGFGIYTEREMRKALQFLHDVGLLAHYEEGKLDAIVILDPQWLAKMMATIISFTNKYVKNGVLEYKGFQQIWKGEYPSDLYPQLIELLEKFEILYPLVTSENTAVTAYLVPSLLPEERPQKALIKIWPRKVKLGWVQFGRVYQFEFVPLGFFARLMVRIAMLPHLDISQNCCWRNGVCFLFCLMRLYLSFFFCSFHFTFVSMFFF